MSDISIGETPVPAGEAAAAKPETPAVSERASKDSDAKLQNFALLMSAALQAQATSMLASGASGNADAPLSSLGMGMGMDSSLLGLMLSALSGGEDIDPQLAALMMGSLSGGGIGGIGSLSGGGTGGIGPLSAGTPLAAFSQLPLADFAVRKAGSSLGGGEIAPYNAWIAASPAVCGGEGNRSAELLNEIIAQFDVESSGRYKPYKYGGDTYCNIFVWDVTNALGVEIPHFVDPQTGEPRYYPDVDGAMELGANDVCDWLHRYGRAYGWKEVGPEEAQRCANSGRPAVTAWKNPGGPGHVQVVCPSKNGAYDSARGVTVAQSGRTNCAYAYITATLNKENLSAVRYFVHA